MADFYTLPGSPSDTLTSEVVGERRWKTEDEAVKNAVDASALSIVDAIGNIDGGGGDTSIGVRRQVFTYSGNQVSTKTIYGLDGTTIDTVLSYDYDLLGNLLEISVVSGSLYPRRVFAYSGDCMDTQTVYLSDGVTISYTLTYIYDANENLLEIQKA